MRAMMIDLETMGDTPDAAIVSVGAVFADLDRPAESDVRFYERVELQSSLDAGLVVTAGTVKWWFEQSAEARREIVAAGRPLTDVLESLSEAFRELHPLTVWASPATFDVPILATAYRLVKLTAPWSYRAVRCWSTLRRDLDIKTSTSRTPHHALEDAAAQMRDMRLAYASLKTSRPGAVERLWGGN